ncbi:MAG: hypothetical protein CMD72_00560 [Gammaproteobacteria bacterium]|nr:hypothetical protein [Gammaproteobacteria bacterium]
MSYISNSIKKISVYFLPLSAFFLLISSAATNIFIILSLLAAIFYFLKNKDYKEVLNKNIFKFCFLIYLLFLFSSFYSIGNTEDIISMLKKYIKLIYIPFLFYLIKIQKNQNIIIKFFISGASVILILSYFKYYDIVNFNYFYDFLRNINIANTQEKIINTKTSIFQNYIIQGIVLSFYSFLCVYIANKNKKYLYYLLSALSFFNVLFLNDSRTAYIIIVILTIFSFLKIIDNNKIRLIFFLFIISMLSTQMTTNLENRVNILSNDAQLIKNNKYNSSLGLRFIWTKIGIENITINPVFGFGVGAYKKTSIDYIEKHHLKYYDYYVTDNPHNEFISISTQLGLIGIIFFVGFLYSLILESVGILSKGVIIVVVLSSVFNSAFHDNMLGLFLVLIISLFYQNKFNLKI